MPIIKSAIKRARQTTKRRSHNLKVRAAIKADMHVAMSAIATGESTTITEALKAAQSEIDRAVKKGTLHRNTASRKLSRLVLAGNKVVAVKPVKEPKVKAEKVLAPKSKKPVAKKASSKKSAK
ncbi:MAG: 30S ribosomal protein S20 [Candidatus Saccharimonadia bacterium]